MAPTYCLVQQLRSGEWSDFKIVCRDKEFRVPRSVICPQSGFFDTMCKSSFKEANESVVDLSEDEPEIITRVLFYLYTGEYRCDLPKDIGFTRTWDPKSSPENPSISTEITEHTLKENGNVENYHPQSAGAQLAAIYLSPEGHEIYISPQGHHMYLSSEGHQIIKSLQNHAKMTFCADRLGIMSLKSQACHQFQSEIDQISVGLQRTPWFTDIIRHVFENTSGGDMGEGEDRSDNLRWVILTRILNASSPDEFSQSAQNLIEEHEPIAFTMMQFLQLENNRTKRSLEKLEKYEKDNERLVKSNEKLQRRVSICLEDVKTKNSEYEELLRQMKSIQRPSRMREQTQKKQLACLSQFLSQFRFCHTCAREFGWGGLITLAVDGRSISIACSGCGKAVVKEVE